MTEYTALVVDDSEDIQRILSDVLGALNIKVKGKAFNGLEAVKKYQKIKPQLVFLDIQMPKYDGIFALKEIMKIDHKAKVIIITADAREKTSKIVQDLGAINILYKPFRIKDIENILNQIHR